MSTDREAKKKHKKLCSHPSPLRLRGVLERNTVMAMELDSETL